MTLRLFILAILIARVSLQGAEPRIETVFGPETPTGRYKHPASITALSNGDLYLVFYGGSGEYATDTSVFGSRLKKGETRWSAPMVIAHDPFRSTGNGVAWQAPDGAVWLFYVVRYGATWSTSRIQAKVSHNNAETWSDASVLDAREGMMVRCHPILLKNGDYLLPIYHETGQNPERVGPESASLFLRFDPRSKTWKPTDEIHSRLGNIQPAVAEITADYLVAYCRRGADYAPRTDGFLVRSESRDGGRTWTPGAEIQLPNPNSAVEFIKLQNGHLLLLYNDSMYKRTPLTVAISTDQDRTYPTRKNLVAGENDFAYPAAVQSSDGLIHVVYTSDGRTIIHHAVFSEEWVTSR